MDYRIFPPEGWLEAAVTLPLSKSMSARALVINAFAGAVPSLEGMADCDDVSAIMSALSATGAAEINVGPAGTAMRFLTALFASRPGADVVIDGDERMRLRPIGPLVEALRQAGADIEYVAEEGFPPLHIRGRVLSGGEVEMDGSVSSQFASALMMAAPLMVHGLKLTLRGEIISLPYILMTLGMMQQAGAEGEFYGGDTVEIRPGAYQPTPFRIEGDWSAAAPWFEIEALSSGEVVIGNLEKDSLQGDCALARVFHKLGVVTDFEPEEAEGTLLSVHPDPDARIDMNLADTPDIVPAVTVTCCMLGLPFHLTGLASLSIKECDRIAALVTEMRKVGAKIEVPARGEMRWDGSRRPIFELPRFSTYGDHRLAMAFAPVSVFIPGIIVENPEVVSKSYPEFWEHLTAAGFTLLDADAPVPDPEEEADE